MEVCKQHVLTALDFRDTKLVVEHNSKRKRKWELPDMLTVDENGIIKSLWKI